MHEDATCNDLQEIITQAINEIKQEQGKNFSLSKINLAELERWTGLSRSRLRRLKEIIFIVTPHGRTGQKATATVLTGYSGIIDGLLRKGVTNSSVCFERLQKAGYTGASYKVAVCYDLPSLRRKIYRTLPKCPTVFDLIV